MKIYTILNAAKPSLRKKAFLGLLFVAAVCLPWTAPCYAQDQPQIFVQQGHHFAVDLGGMSTNGEYLATYSGSDVVLWQMHSRLEVFSQTCRSTIQAAQPNNDGSKLVVITRREHEPNSTICIEQWDTATQEIENYRHFFRCRFVSIFSSFEGERRSIVYQSEDTNIWYYGVWNGQWQELASIPIDFEFKSAEFNASGDAVYILSHSNALYRWDLVGNQLVKVGDIPAAADECNGISVSSDEQSLVFWGGRSEELYACSLPDLGLQHTYEHSTWIRQGIISPDGSLVAALGNSVVVWRMDTGERLAVFTGLKESDSTIAFSPDSRWLLMGGEPITSNGSYAGVNVFIWDSETGQSLQPLEGTSLALDQGSVSQDMALVCSMDRAFLWDLAHGRLVEVFPLRYWGYGSSIDYRGTVAHLARRRDVAAVLYDENTIRIFNYNTNETLMELKTENIVSGIAMFPAGNSLIVHYREKNEISIYNIDKCEISRTINIDSLSLFKDAIISFGNKCTIPTISDGNTTCIIDFIHGKIWEVNASRATVLSDGETILMEGFGHEGVIELFNLNSGELCREYNTTGGLSDPPEARIYDIAVSPDNRFVAMLSDDVDAYAGVWDLESGEYLSRSAPWHGRNRITQVLFPDDDRLLTLSLDGTARLWDVEKMSEIARFIAFPDGEWIVMTPEGYYNSSARGHERVTVRIGGNIYSMDQFYDVFYRPDLVEYRLQGGQLREVAPYTLAEVLTSPPPAVTLAELPENTDRQAMEVPFTVRSQGGGIGDVRVFVNGKLVRSDGFYRALEHEHYEQMASLETMNGRDLLEQNRNFMVMPTQGHGAAVGLDRVDIYEDTVVVDLVPGENTITICAFNGDNTVQSTLATVTVTCTAEAPPPHLYIIAVGIDDYSGEENDLAYAVRDARDVAAKIKVAAASLFSTGNIHTTVLLDAEATREGILAAMKDVADKTLPGDSFVLFLAGHGILAGDEYSFVTQDFEGSLSRGCLVTSADLVEASKRIKAMSQLMILDTCHAGGVDYLVSGLYDARISTLARQLGLHIYAACSSTEQALDGFEGNGLFTHTLLEGLGNPQVDIDADDLVGAIELGAFARDRTLDISGGLGFEQRPVIVNFGEDMAIYNLHSSRSLQ